MIKKLKDILNQTKKLSSYGDLRKSVNEQKAFMALPFVLFLTALGIIYIANSYYVERTIRNISNLQSDLQEKRAEFIELRTNLNIATRQSVVIEKVKDTGLKQMTRKPFELRKESNNIK